MKSLKERSKKAEERSRKTAEKLKKVIRPQRQSKRSTRESIFHPIQMYQKLQPLQPLWWVHHQYLLRVHMRPMMAILECVQIVFYKLLHDNLFIIIFGY